MSVPRQGWPRRRSGRRRRVFHLRPSMLSFRMLVGRSGSARHGFYRNAFPARVFHRAQFMTAILGISAFYHDSAAALVVDGEIVAAAQEERFTRKKHDPGFPAQAIAYCLQEAGARRGSRLRRVLRQAADQVRAAAGDLPGLRPARIPQLPAGDAALAQGQAAHAADDPPGAGRVRRKARLVFTDHHESHAASAFFPSPFEEAAILTLDGVGEWSTATLRRRRRATGSA